jgi:mRNA interferase RelE/StbE
MSDELEDKPPDRYALRIAKTAEKDLYKLQNKQFAQVAKKIFSLQGNPKPQDCKQLNGYPGGYRVDQGEYRILYTINDELKMVDVFRVGKRNDDEVYRNL